MAIGKLIFAEDFENVRGKDYLISVVKLILQKYNKNIKIDIKYSVHRFFYQKLQGNNPN